MRPDPRPYKAALDSATAQLERARAATILAELREQRVQKPLPKNVVSQEDADSRHADYVRREADVLDAEAGVALAKLNLEFTQVRAPIDGRTGHAMLTIGNLAVADQTLMTTMVSQDPVYVDFDPDEQTYIRYSTFAKQGEQSASGLPRRAFSFGLAFSKAEPERRYSNEAIDLEGVGNDGDAGDHEHHRAPINLLKLSGNVAAQADHSIPRVGMCVRTRTRRASARGKFGRRTPSIGRSQRLVT